MGRNPPERWRGSGRLRSERVIRNRFARTWGVRSGGCRLWRRTSMSGARSCHLTPREASRNVISCFWLALHLFKWFCMCTNGPAPHAEQNRGSCMVCEASEGEQDIFHEYKRKQDASRQTGGSPEGAKLTSAQIRRGLFLTTPI